MHNEMLTVTSPRTILSSRAFRHSATAIWNNLPADIRGAIHLHIFKRMLKTQSFFNYFQHRTLVNVIILHYIWLQLVLGKTLVLEQFRYFVRYTLFG